MNIVKHNSVAWDKASGLEKWTKPVSSEVIQRAKDGSCEILLTNSKFVPENWYMPVKGKKILCLACGGGQQAPIFSALGGDVVVIDISEKQLQGDRVVKEREGLNMEIIKGDMCDLSMFANETFDMIFHPISNCFIPDPTLVWKESYRVLKKGGTLLSGLVNPILYLFDLEKIEQGKLIVTNTIPYSDIDQLPKDQLEKRILNKETLEYGHSLETLIGGQTAEGFAIIDFYEDISYSDTLDKYINSSFATKGIKI